jgi:imidazolonepropionase-like amidohydrolase
MSLVGKVLNARYGVAYWLRQIRGTQMRLGFVVAAALLASCSSTAPLEATSDSVLIEHVLIASPERDDVYGPVSVRIADGRIAAIDASLRPARGETVIDGAGRYLSPGLIDGHTHLGDVPGLREDQAAAHPAMAAEAQAQIPRSYLFYGFTTVVDLISSAERMAAWNSIEVRPQAYYCGGAPVLDGYPTNFIPAPLRYQILPGYLIDSSRTEPLPDSSDPAQHSPEVIVAGIQEDGAICVKTFYETGFGAARNLPVPGVETMRAVVAAAHARRMPVILHANSQNAQAFGVAAGVDAFAHGMWTWNDNSQSALTPEIEALAALEIAAGIGMMPTIQVLYGEGEVFDAGFLARPALADALPASLLAWYATPEGQWFHDEMAEGPYGEVIIENGWERAIADSVARVTAVTRYYATHDGRLLFGSDTPSGPTYANPPGLNGRWEMDRWTAAGVSPSRLFRAATIDNAAFFGLDDEIGTVEVGKRADLLLLNASPFESVSAFDGITIVLAGGRAIERSELSARRH